MQKRSSKKPIRKEPPDENQAAFNIVNQVTANSQTISEVMRMMGRKGGLKGGKARRDALTPEQRVEIAKKAAAKRWQKNK